MRFCGGCVVVLFLAGATGRAAEAEQGRLRHGPAPLVAAPGEKITLLSYDNGDASPWAEFFCFDSPSHPKLVQLRRDYKLDELVAGAKTDLERAVALKRWVGTLWKFGTPKPEMFQDWSAVGILERMKQGERGWCGQAAMVFQQACLAVGMPARYIELGIPKSPACHFTTEVFLREHKKWAVVDATPLPECDAYYAVGGVPQSALEMHRHVVRGTMDRVVEAHSDRSRPVRAKEGAAWWFYYVRWLTRCDVVANTPKFADMENTFDRRWQTVEWADAETIPWERQPHALSWIRNERPSAWNTSDPEVVSWRPTDRVRMVLRPGDPDWVFVQVWAADLDCDHLQVRVDSAGWEDLPAGNTSTGSGPHFGWGPKKFSVARTPGTHEARCRLVRRDGSCGPESFVCFRVE